MSLSIAAVATVETDPLKASEAELPDVDSFLAQELNQLSFQKRSIIQEEIHGVQSMAIPENPEMIQNAFQKLQKEILAIPSKQKAAYEEALRLAKEEKTKDNHAIKTCYVQSQDYMLKYLRADLFDAGKAASRLAKHLNLLYHYFGPAALQRPLRLSDLNKKDQELLRGGYMQVLPSRDRAGRLVSFSQGVMNGKDITTTNRIKMLLYFYHVVSEDVETQKKGLVSIVSCEKGAAEIFYQSTREEQRHVLDLFMNHPVRESATHFCVPSQGPSFKILKALWAFINTSKDERFRMRPYPGMNMETQYSLLTFGIPVQELPLSSSGTIKTKNHIQWIKYRKANDEAREALESNHKANGKYRFVGIFHPGIHDVLFSRGGNSSHYGNMELQSLMAVRRTEYNSASSRKERRQICQDIINIVHNEKQGRFLEMDREGQHPWWCEINDPDLLRKKLITAMYDHNRRVNVRINQQKLTSESKTLSSMTRQHPQSSKRRKLDGGSNCCR